MRKKSTPHTHTHIHTHTHTHTPPQSQPSAGGDNVQRSAALEVLKRSGTERRELIVRVDVQSARCGSEVAEAAVEVGEHRVASPGQASACVCVHYEEKASRA
jgi:hypothetical protein